MTNEAGKQAAVLVADVAGYSHLAGKHMLLGMPLTEADVDGYSRLAGADEDQVLARLQGLRKGLVDTAIVAHHGVLVRRTGDRAIVEFRSALDAARCAIDIQKGMVGLNASLSEDRRSDFRIGIHVGDVLREPDGDLRGEGVDVASRLEGVSAPGAICLSEDAHREVMGRLDVAVTYLGPKQSKNGTEPIQAYSLEVGKPAQTRQLPGKLSQEPKKAAGRGPLAAGLAALLAALVLGSWYLLSGDKSENLATGSNPWP